MIDRRTAITAGLAAAGAALGVPRVKKSWFWVLKDKGGELYFQQLIACGRGHVWCGDAKAAMKLPADTHSDSLTCIKNLVEDISGSKVEWVKR